MSKRTVTNYTAEFRESSAKLASESDQSIQKTASELGLNSSTLHGWVNKYYPASSRAATIGLESAEQLEIKRLKKELARALQERDILKKATAYFAKEAQ